MATTFPDWQRLTPEYVTDALPRLLKDAESAVAALESREADTFEAYDWALNDATRALWCMWSYVGHETAVMNSPAWRTVEESFQPQIVAFSLRVSQSPKLYAQARALLTKIKAQKTPDPIRVRILEHAVRGAEHAGVGLSGAAKERFNEIAARLAKLSMDFANAVIDATAAFKYEKDGKTYTIDDANYPETMKHCPDRAVREKLCRARAVRAPENAERIVEILRLRAEMAALLGFDDYAALSLDGKCAPSVAAAYEMIGRLDAATLEAAAREERELAAEVNDLLQPWDRAYYAERLRERKYAYSEEELKKFFALEDVLKGLFKMTKFLFGVEVVECAGNAKPSVWHPDVRFFAVREQGKDIAHFYLDPFVRSGFKQGGAWMNEFRNRCDRRGETPLAVLVLNCPLPDATGKCLLPFREVETIFHEFGHALQCMLTRVGEEDVAGIGMVEWDAVEVASQFMENWCLNDRTGIVVPDELKVRVKAAKNFRAASVCRRQLAFAKTDLLLHGRAFADELAAGTSTPDAVKREQFAHFGMASVPEDAFLNAFTHIFAGGYAAGYYGYKWAEVMSADCYGAFEEAPLTDDVAVQRVGKAYRETLLAEGGSKSARDVFRDFRGRDPDIAAILRQQGL